MLESITEVIGIEQGLQGRDGDEVIDSRKTLGRSRCQAMTCKFRLRSWKGPLLRAALGTLISEV